MFGLMPFRVVENVWFAWLIVEEYWGRPVNAAGVNGLAAICASVVKVLRPVWPAMMVWLACFPGLVPRFCAYICVPSSYTLMLNAPRKTVVLPPISLPRRPSDRKRAGLGKRGD